MNDNPYASPMGRGAKCGPSLFESMLAVSWAVAFILMPSVIVIDGYRIIQEGKPFNADFWLLMTIPVACGPMGCVLVIRDLLNGNWGDQ